MLIMGVWNIFPSLLDIVHNPRYDHFFSKLSHLDIENFEMVYPD